MSSQDSLDNANKRHHTVDKHKKVLRRFHYYGIAVQAGAVFGFDGDDKSIFRRSVELYKEIGVDSATISVLIPFPNTPLFKRLEDEGRILTRDWSKYDGKKHVVFQPTQMSPKELLMGMEWAARQFYSIPSIILSECPNRAVASGGTFLEIVIDIAIRDIFSESPHASN